MKKAILMIVVLMGVSGPVMAQEQQVYSSYPPLAFQPAPQPSPQQMYMDAHRNRIYPGREMYGDNFGPIPHHPGDYRDAVDRGQWSAGEPHYNSRGPQLFYDQ